MKADELTISAGARRRDANDGPPADAVSADAARRAACAGGRDAGATRSPVAYGPMLRSPRRLAFAGLGLVCFGLALAGVFLPGLPTTVFLIAASYLFARSCPVLEERMLRMRLFRPYLRYLDAGQPLPRRARVTALALMWTAVSISLAVLALGDRLAPWGGATIVVAALVGTGFIVRFRRGARAR